MNNISTIPRKILSQRHRLSHQQIDVLLKEKNSKEHLPEKIELMLQVKEFIQLTDLFRDANLEFIPLKGPLLSYRLYNDSSVRYSNDLDFLIPLNCVKNVIHILEKAGYEPYYFSWPISLQKEKRLIKNNNQILFFHPEKEICIEIHWRLFKLEITNSKVLSEVVKSNLDKIRFNERNFKILNNELELLYLIIHGGLHAWFRLKWLIDVKEYIEKVSFNSEKFALLTEKYNAAKMVSLCNATLSHYFPESQLLSFKSVHCIKRKLKFTLSEIDNEICCDKTFIEKTKLYWFKINCFSSLKFKLSVIATTFYAQYLKTFEYHRTT